MSLVLTDQADPTVALFISRTSAERASGMVKRAYGDKVRKCVVKPRTSKGELLGFQVIAHHRDASLTGPITNSDYERISA